MLPARHRLHRSAEFRDVLRSGRRSSRGMLTVHVDLPIGAAAPGGALPARAGLVVSKAVGGSVVRSRTSRRLRHLLRDRLPLLPPGTRLVVRAGPGAGDASSARLAGDLDAALARLRLPVPDSSSPA